jgi:hypothetical protein
MTSRPPRAAQWRATAEPMPPPPPMMIRTGLFSPFIWLLARMIQPHKSPV